MSLEGGCQCKQVRYAVEGDPEHSAFCHCSDCRASSGAPVMVWSAFPAGRFSVLAGEAKTYGSNGSAIRHFCANCGTGLWYTNEAALPGLVDIQTATLDAPEALPPGAHIQAAEELTWMKSAHDLPHFDRYPGAE
jgi:hypothetical protein